MHISLIDNNSYLKKQPKDKTIKKNITKVKHWIPKKFNKLQYKTIILRTLCKLRM